MNVNEVPQDERGLKDGAELKKLMYAVGKDGKYTGVNSAGWEAENFALKQAWDDIEQNLVQTAEQVTNGTLSPIAYFMQKNLMDIALLASYAGKWQWQVRRHLQPAIFRKLSPDMIARYAAIFNITTDELIHFGERNTQR